MPELPEVEVVKESLKKVVLNKKIVNVDVYYNNIFIGDDSLLKKSLINEKFIDILRYGKYLVFVISNDLVLISHLRMEGKYHLRTNEPIGKHEHIVFTFEDGQTLRYHDTRKFGKMELRQKNNYLTTKPLNKLGPEPKDMTKEQLYERLQKTTRPIKVSLLDQTIIAGLGNIYVDETLFLSKIHPTRISNTITLKEAEFIINNAKITLEKATKLGGTTIHTFSATEIDGLFQNELLVHTKKDQPCPVCGTSIIKIKVGGRGTYVCENCQK